MQSHLGKAVGRTPTSDEELRAMRAAAWHQQGLVMVKPDDIPNEGVRRYLVADANEQFGERK